MKYEIRELEAFSVIGQEIQLTGWLYSERNPAPPIPGGRTYRRDEQNL
ncbi:MULTISPECIES: hypothetical protein [Eisenbergiella]|nr:MULTISPECIES: hypothetical protein [Eisenbergiella]